MHYALLFLLLPSCSQTEQDTPDTPDFEEGIPTEVRITLSALSENAQTRAEGDDPGTPKDPNSSVELIHNWWIAFIDKNGKVTILKDEDVADADKTTVYHGNLTDEQRNGGYEAQTFKMILPTGTYRYYAFANINPMTATNFTKLLNKNHELGNKYINDFVSTEFTDGMQWPSAEYIPMTGTLADVKIKNTVEEAYNVEVVRAVAKVEFAFSNPSTDNITLQNLEFSPISKGDNISIVPNYGAIGKGPNIKILQDILKGKAPANESGTLTFDLNSKNLPQSTSDYVSALEFYCKESLAPLKATTTRDYIINDKKKLEVSDLEHFTITLTVSKNGVAQDPRTFYTSKIQYINRNDWIYIPIKFSNWIFKWKLHFYPPIGGYPPVFNQADDGTKLSATLTTGGEFELYPVEVLQNSTSYKVDMNNNDMTVEVKSTTNSKLFITEPHIVANPNKDVNGHPLSAFEKIITGELDPKETGDAVIEIKFYLTAASNITEALTCTFTIHRQNSTP